SKQRSNLREFWIKEATSVDWDSYLEFYELTAVNIINAFKRCFGLSGFFRSNEQYMKQAAFNSLANQTGLRESFLKDFITNFPEILQYESVSNQINYQKI
ncbi:hypothetical protein V6O07_03790, partial [Arthrospira platensis SPKY2]